MSQPYCRTKKDLNGEATGCLCPSSQHGHIEYFSVSCFFFLTTKLAVLIGLWKVNDRTLLAEVQAGTLSLVTLLEKAMEEKLHVSQCWIVRDSLFVFSK